MVPTVRETLGFVPGSMSLERFEYITQIPPRRSHHKSAHMSRVDVDSRVAPYAEDLRAGAPDAWVARQAGLTRYQVKEARHRLDILRRPGRQLYWRRWLAISALGGEPLIMPTRSPLNGQWQIPEYVLRRPLDYTKLVAVVRAAAEAGMGVETIAAGLGLRTRDVEAARVLGDRL